MSILSSPTLTFDGEAAAMGHALSLARQGIGRVEPNPAVGAVVLGESGELLGAGWHQACGGPHAEVHALHAAGERARGATLIVTLEPCHHHGRTPPCTEAVIAAGIRRVVIGAMDPAPHTSGAGLARLQSAGIEVSVGIEQEAAEDLIAPFRKRMTTGLPFVIAKWAMTLDGRIATQTGASRWISNEASRERVQLLRGRMDGIVVGIGTALADDPLLLARPAGPRCATRVVIDSRARLPVNSQLVRTVDRGPVVLVTGGQADQSRVERLRAAGVEVWACPVPNTAEVDLVQFLKLGGERDWTNLLVEGGGALLGSFWQQRLIDEVHVFVAPKLIGGATAPGPIAGAGDREMPALPQLTHPHIEILQGDVYISGRFN